MSKQQARKRRARKTSGIAKRSGRTILRVYRSANHTYAGIVEGGEKGDLIRVSASTIDKQLKKSMKGNKSEKAYQVGKALAERAKDLGISEVAFDRSGYKYHGRVKALAEGAREAGLIF